MSTYSTPVDVVPLTKVRAADVNNLDAATAAAFALLPDETKLKLGTVQFAVDTGAADAYLVALTHTPGAYADGMVVNMRPTNTNTGASTINVNSLGVKSIRHASSAALSAGDIVTGAPLTLIYSTNTGFFHTTGGMGSSTAAAASAVAAASSASASEVSNLASAVSAAASAASYDSFDDRYLGAKASDPTLDNDGNALATGALYWNTASSEMKVYTGAVWTVSYAPNTAASQAEMEAGTEVALRSMSPLRVAQAITAQVPLLIPVASQAEQEAGSSTTKFVAPGRQHFHPSAAKAWLKCNVAGAVSVSYNITSVTDTGTGIVDVTIATDFSSADYAVVGCAQSGAGLVVTVNTQAAGAFQALGNDVAGVPADPTNYYFACFGDQA
jgi:hypothetical protein